ncbi:hypothetical protein TW86_14695 [Halomonas sp. S2151]|nr:hypothetical protein TW86_14695 [Halomonas sp. S2151]
MGLHINERVLLDGIVQGENKATWGVFEKLKFFKKNFAKVLERRVVNITIEQMDLIAIAVCANDTIVGPVLTLAFPVEPTAFNMVMVLGECALFFLGDEKHDKLAFLGRHYASRYCLEALKSPMLGKLWALIAFALLQTVEINRHPFPP